MLKRIEVMAPPKSAPQYRDVSRMIAEVGGIVKVSGSRMATPLAPPSPGSTPMTVPSKIPTTAMNTLNGVMARWKPWARFSRPTRSVPQPGLEGALGHGHQEPLLEDDERHHGNRHRQPDDGHPAVAAHPPYVEPHVHGGGDVESHELHEDDGGGRRPEHLQHRSQPLPGEEGLGRGPAQRLEHDGDAGDDHDDGEPEGKECAPRAVAAPADAEAHRGVEHEPAAQRQDDGREEIGDPHASLLSQKFVGTRGVSCAFSSTKGGRAWLELSCRRSH